MRWLQIGQSSEVVQTEGVHVVVATAVEDVRARALKREDVLGLLFLVHGAVIRLPQIVDQKSSRLAASLACSEEQLLLRDEVKRLNLFFESFEDSYVSQADCVPHYDVFLGSSEQEISLFPIRNRFDHANLVGQVAAQLHRVKVPDS